MIEQSPPTISRTALKRLKRAIRDHIPKPRTQRDLKRLLNDNAIARHYQLTPLCEMHKVILEKD